ncbi:MAG: putative transposase [Arcticibacterium sp.]|jgi:putative transposase
MLVRSRKRKYFTTQSHHWLRKCENLIRDKVITQPSQLWVADIIYVKVMARSIYSTSLQTRILKKIVGRNLR